MIIDNKFDEREKQLLKDINVDIYENYDEEKLEELEDKVCEKMTNSLDKNQDFTPLAEEYENILNKIVDIENSIVDIREEIYNELVKQGERQDIASFLVELLETPFQQQTMMKYLISIREEYVSEVEVIQMTQRISEMKE